MSLMARSCKQVSGESHENQAFHDETQSLLFSVGNHHRHCKWGKGQAPYY